MELHLEFHPHRFITRFNAIQKELEAREVIYIEDDEEEEEEGIVEEIQEGAHVHEGHHSQEGEGEGEHGESDVACRDVLMSEEGKTDTHQLAVPLPPAETGQNVTGKLRSLHMRIKLINRRTATS